MNKTDKLKSEPRWTSELPKESGFYWYRDQDCFIKPTILEWNQEDNSANEFGSEVRMYQYGLTKENNGQFWSERLEAPK